MNAYKEISVVHHVALATALACAMPLASGAVELDGGTVSVSSAAALGAEPVTLRYGTLRFTGDATFANDVVLGPNTTAKEDSAVVLRVDSGVAAVATGTMGFASGCKGHVVKTGPGTFTLRTTAAGSINDFSRTTATTIYNTSWNTPALNIAANGDGPTTGFSSFNVAEGRFVVDVADSVTNLFGNEAFVGLRSSGDPGGETAGHLDIYGGVNKFAGVLAVGRYNGSATTAPDGLESSVNVYGGCTTCTAINMAYTGGPMAGDTASEMATMRPQVNVHGGALDVAGDVRLDYARAKAFFTVDGGVFTVDGNVINGNYDGYTAGTELGLNVSGTGRFVCKGTFQAAKLARGTANISVSDGGTLEVKALTAADGSDVSLSLDGGVFKSIQYDYGDAVSGGRMYITANGGTIDLTDAGDCGPKWLMPVSGSDGAALRIVSNGGERKSMRLQTTDVSLPGGIDVVNSEVMLSAGTYPVSLRLDKTSAIRIVGDVTVGSLAFSGDTGTLVFGVTGDSAAASAYQPLKANAFVPPSGTIHLGRMKGDSTSDDWNPVGTFDLFTFPASVDCNLSRFVFDRENDGYVYTLLQTVSDGWRTIVLDVSPASPAVDPRTSNDWQSGTAPWSIGSWLYVHSAGTLTTAAPLVPNPAQNRYAGISTPAGVALTLTGGMREQKGGFAKMGDGVLRFAGDAMYHTGAAYSPSQNIYGGETEVAIFDGATNGAPAIRSHQGALVVGRGTLALGSGSDGPRLVVSSGELDIGTRTTDTAGQEDNASFVMDSGWLSVASGSTTIGLVHGLPATRAREPLVSSYVQNGGTAEVQQVMMDYDWSKTARQDARFVLNGGAFRCASFQLGQENDSTVASSASFEMTGGSLAVLDGAFAPANKSSGLRTVTFTMSGGEAAFEKGFACGSKGPVTLNLDGGRIRYRDAFTGGGAATLNWNGTVIAPVADAGGVSPAFSGFAAVNVTGDAIVDVSEAREFDIGFALNGAGRVVVRGSNTNNVLRLPTTAGSLADVVVEAGGVVMPRGGASESMSVTVKDGGGVCNYYNSKVYGLALGESASDEVSLYGYEMGGNLYSVWVTDSLSVNGRVYVAFRNPLSGALSMEGGSHVVLRAPKGSLSSQTVVDCFAIHPALVARGTDATFLVDTSDSACDALIAVATSVTSTWTQNGGGAWGQASNWDVAPSGTSYDDIVFPSTLASDATVTVGSGEGVAQRISQNSAAAVVLSGPFDLNRAAGGAAFVNVANAAGVLDFAGALSIGSGTGTLYSSRESGAGTIRISGSVQGAPTITVKSGRLEGGPAAFGAATIDLANTTLRFTSDGVCTASVSHAASDYTGVGLEAAPGCNATLAGAFLNRTALAISGPGTVVFANGGSGNILAGRQKNSTDVPWSAGTNGDVPNSPLFSVYAGVAAFDGGENSVYSAAEAYNFSCVGFHPISDGSGGAHTAGLEVRSGVVDLKNELNVGRIVSEAYDSPVALGIVRRPYRYVNVSGGELRTRGFVMGYSNYKYCDCSLNELNVSGGSLVVESGLFVIAFDGSSIRLDDGGNESVVNLDGGLIDYVDENNDVVFGRYNDSAAAVYPARGVLNIGGGEFRTTASKGLKLCNQGNVHGSLALHGGVLHAGYVVRGSTAAGTVGDIYFDGGTYKPRMGAQTLSGFSGLYVGEGGAKFDLSEAGTLTLGQGLATTNGLAQGATDGGVTLDGGGTLTLGATNAFSGVLRANAGRIVASFAEAASCASGVEVNGTGVLDLNGDTVAVGALAGDGGLVTNGILVVTNSIAPKSTVTVANLVVRGGTVVSCPVSESGGSYVAPYVKVAESLSATDGRRVEVDFCRTAENPLPYDCTLKVMEIPEDAPIPRLSATGTGIEGKRCARWYAVQGDGCREVWAEFVQCGFAVFVQ